MPNPLVTFIFMFGWVKDPKLEFYDCFATKRDVLSLFSSAFKYLKFLFFYPKDSCLAMSESDPGNSTPPPPSSTPPPEYKERESTETEPLVPPPPEYDQLPNPLPPPPGYTKTAGPSELMQSRLFSFIMAS